MNSPWTELRSSSVLGGPRRPTDLQRSRYVYRGRYPKELVAGAFFDSSGVGWYPAAKDSNAPVK